MARLISPASGSLVVAAAEETAAAVRPPAEAREARLRPLRPRPALRPLGLPPRVLERVVLLRPVRLLRLAQVAELPRLAAADVAAADAADVVPPCARRWPMESSRLRSSKSRAMPPASRRCCRGRQS